MRNHSEQALDLVRRWNSSAHIWKRRASVVTFTRKIGESGKYTSEVLELCEPLLFDPEDLVRKGVGWALKDNLRGDHATVLAYVKELRRRGVSSVITLYAIRDLSGAERAACSRSALTADRRGTAGAPDSFGQLPSGAMSGALPTVISTEVERSPCWSHTHSATRKHVACRRCCWHGRAARRRSLTSVE